jgi:hypothetical protein
VTTARSAAAAAASSIEASRIMAAELSPVVLPPTRPHRLDRSEGGGATLSGSRLLDQYLMSRALDGRAGRRSERPGADATRSARECRSPTLTYARRASRTRLLELERGA